jgi:predicted HicB family RNase H-like nuclease
MAKRRKGRPKLPREATRRFSVHVLVTPEEHRRVKRAARASDMSISAWAREKILAGLPRR